MLGIGLAADAFAASISRGLRYKKLNWPNVASALITSLSFGVFQAVMPLVGWFLGSFSLAYIQRFDHWVAFGLLALVGTKMIIDALRGSKTDRSATSLDEGDTSLHLTELVVLSFATSIDALIVGISLAMVSVNIYAAISIIGLTTFAICLIGSAIGFFFGSRFEKSASIIGGIILIMIGVRILVEHLS